MGVETLALLCAGSTAYHQVRGGKGSGESLSRAEIAGLLATLDPVEVYLCQAKYMGDLAAESRLIELVQTLARAKAASGKWRIVNGRPCIDNMAALAVFDVVRPNRCNKCKGTGFVRVVKVCGCCGGSGFGALSGRTIAEAIGVDECNYRRIWKMRYQSMYYFVQAIDCNVKQVIHDNSFDRSFMVA